MRDRPNVLVLMDDEHRPDVLGYAGNDVVRTPTIDGLADDGVVFENAHTPAPRCVPARQCIAAGQLPNTCGCERYGDDLDPGSRTFARQFTEHGYRTVAAGKLHHPGWDKLQGWRKHVGPQVPVDDRYVDAQEPGTLDSGPVTERSQVDEIRRAGVGYGRNRSMDDQRGDLSYVYCGAGEWFDAAPEVLFDLDADPDERENRAGDPAYDDALAALRRRRDALGHGPDADPEYTDAGYDARTATRAYAD